MSIVDAILFVSVVVLFLVILTVMREIVILRGETLALSQLVVDPPVPSYLGKTLPTSLAERLRLDTSDLELSERMHAILFLKSSCEGCSDLASDVERAIAEGVLDRSDVSSVVAAGEEAPIAQAARRISRITVLDPRGDLLAASEVRATPTVLTVRADTLQVLDYKLGGEVEWIAQQLKRPQENILSPRPVSMAPPVGVS